MDHRDRNDSNPLEAERAAQEEAEVATAADAGSTTWQDDAVILAEEATDTDPAVPAELAAIHTDTEAALVASGDVESTPVTDEPVKAKPPKKAAISSATRAKKRSIRYQEQASKVDINRRYPVKQALELAKETSYAKFDGAMEVHIALKQKKGKKADGERFRLLVTLPHGTGREARVGVLDEALIEDIKKKGDTEFDILLATPAMMPKVAQIAKILGPKGKMPNPKTGTVIDDPETAKRAISSGRVELRADAQSIVHQSIGRVSWDLEKHVENYTALLASMPAHRLQAISVSATMGPAVRVEISR